MKRKGARSLKDIPIDILTQLNAGEIETVNLMEWLAVDQRFLVQTVLRSLDRQSYLKPIEDSISTLAKLSTLSTSKMIGEKLLSLSITHDDLDWFFNLSKHRSDSVRCWLCYGIAVHPHWSLVEKFNKIKMGAQDEHFGVREIAWMAMRSLIIQNLDESLQILMHWAIHPDPYLRRFASEALRPRGVWCQHIEVLKQQPQKATELINLFSKESDKYVKDSVANWLNDASKSTPEFVINICSKWSKLNNKDTNDMIKRALRTLNKI